MPSRQYLANILVLNIQGSLSNVGECQLAVEVAETVQQLTRANPVSIGR